MKYKTKIKWGYIFTIFIFLLIGVGSWAFYKLLNQGIEDLLFTAGISNNYLQSGIIVILVFIILVFVGTGFFKALEKIIGKS